MTDADRNDPAKEIEVSASLIVPQPLHMALVDENRLLVVRQKCRREIFLPDVLALLVRRALSVNTIRVRVIVLVWVRVIMEASVVQW